MIAEVDFGNRRWLRQGSFRGKVRLHPLGGSTYLAEFSHFQCRYLVPLRSCAGCPSKWSTRIGEELFCEAEYCSEFIEEVLGNKLEGIKTEVLARISGRIEFLSTLAEEATNPHTVFRINEKKIVVKGYRVVRNWNPEPLFLKYLSSKGPAPKVYAVYSFGEIPLGAIVEYVEGRDPGTPIYAAALSCVKEERCETPGEIEVVPKALGELHSLMLNCTDPWCAPSSAERENIARWIERVRFYLGTITAHGMATTDLEKPVAHCFEEMGNFEGSTILRVHQDFHFSQTLVTPAGQVVVVDFEGEPARPDWASRELEPGVRDLATLLRALSYISFFSLAEFYGHDFRRVFQALKHGEAATRRIREWGAAATDRLAKAYAVKAPKRVLPTSDSEEALRLALPWFVERALYETVYELEYRKELAAVASGTLTLGLPPLLSS